MAKLPVLFALLAITCDRQAEPSALPEPANAPTPTTETASADADPAFELSLPEISETPSTSTPEHIRELHQRYRAQLRDARALRDDNELADALLGYHALLELDPTDATVLHEFAAVAERLGKHPLAEAALTRALRYARDETQQFRLHTDLGRVLEFAGENDAALDHYREALARHEDSALRARLRREGEAFASLDEVCEHLVRTYFKCTPDKPCTELEDSTCREPFEDQGGAMVLTYEFSDGNWDYIHPVMRTPLGWSTFPIVAEVSNPMFNGMYGEYSASESIHSHAGIDYVIINYAYENTDYDAGIDELETEGEAGVVVCRVDGLRARCEDYTYRTIYCISGMETTVTEGTCEDEGTYQVKGGDIVIRSGKQKTTHSFETELRGEITPPPASAP